MSWTERALLTTKRVDVRLSAVLLALFAPMVGATLFLFFTYAAHELLEEVDRGVTVRAAELQELLSLEPSPALDLGVRALSGPGTGFWIESADGVVHRSGGEDLRGAESWDPAPILNVLRVGREDVLVRTAPLSDGERLFVASRLDRFLEERGELLTGFWISLSAGLVLAAGVALLATRIALAPLRRATAVVDRTDTAGLDARVPVRGTRDDVDLHAAALNRALNRLENGFERIRAFSSDVAHELRTPLNRMLNRAEVAALAAEPGSNEEEALLTIRESAAEMSRMVEGLLLLARAEEGTLPVPLAPVEMKDLVSVLQDLYQPACQDKGVDLVVRAEPSRVHGNETLLLRAISNLLDNALRSSPPGAAIELTVTAEGNQVVVGVLDQGPGIGGADRERVFDRFVRLGGARSGGGSGLGLSIARTIARAHGGDLDLATHHEGGTAFRLRLPIREGAAGEPRAARAGG